MERAPRRRVFVSLPLALGILILRAPAGHAAAPTDASIAERASELARAIEWRGEYEGEVRKICGHAEAMIAAGKTEEDAARYAHAHRRVLGMKFKYYHGRTPPDMLDAIHRRNVAKYGDGLGPTIRWLRAKGKTWRQITQGACAPGGADIVLGLLEPPR